MKRLELRPAAHRDLLRLERSIEKHSPCAALRMFDALTKRILILREHPLLALKAGPASASCSFATASQPMLSVTMSVTTP